MAQKTSISMKKFRASLTKISRLAKSGYNSITSVAKGIISTVTSIASKISVLSDNANWQPPEQSLPADYYTNYYNEMSKAEQQFLNRSTNNLENYKNAVIFDIFTIKDAAAQNTDEIAYRLIESIKRVFGESADSFFEYGVSCGNSFGLGFRESVYKCIEEVKSSIYSTMRSLNSLISTAKNVSSVTYSNSSYNFYGNKQTVSEQLSEARIADTVNALRNS